MTIMTNEVFIAKEVFFENREALFGALTQECAQRLSQSVKTRQQASFIVSGGGTPEPLFKSLSEIDLGWDKINVALVDERWVDADHEKSNQRLIQNSLLQNHGASAQFTAMKTQHQTAIEAQADVSADYRRISQPFDIVLLGMGPDGHTASLFPGSNVIEQALSLDRTELCTAVTAKKSNVTGDMVERMSLTLNGIVNAKQIILLITGEDKLAVYQQALTATDQSVLPVSAVLQQQRCPVSVYWSP
jgi:6-phosphogluconolactonase